MKNLILLSIVLIAFTQSCKEESKKEETKKEYLLRTFVEFTNKYTFYTNKFIEAFNARDMKAMQIYKDSVGMNSYYVDRVLEELYNNK